MHLVDRAGSPPYHCALFPQLAGSRQYVDMGHVLLGVDPQVFVSLDGLRDVLKFLGWPTDEQHQAILSERDELARKVADLEADLAEANRFIESVDMIASRDFVVRKKQGRPKKEPVA